MTPVWRATATDNRSLNNLSPLFFVSTIPAPTSKSQIVMGRDFDQETRLNLGKGRSM